MISSSSRTRAASKNNALAGASGGAGRSRPCSTTAAAAALADGAVDGSTYAGAQTQAVNVRGITGGPDAGGAAG